jgi:hypothetical protein
MQVNNTYILSYQFDFHTYFTHLWFQFAWNGFGLYNFLISSGKRARYTSFITSLSAIVLSLSVLK